MSKFKGKPLKSTENMQNVLDGAETDFDIPERGITKETVQYFKLLRKMDRVNECVDAYYFPVTKKGNLSGYIKLSPNRSKKDGRFSTVGDVDLQCDLLGQREAQQVKKKNTVFVVEGFWDILSSFQSLYNQQPNKGAFVPAVVSPALGIGNTKSPDGTNARQQLATNMEFIQGFNNIRVCFDNDTEGKENVGQLGVQDCALVLQDFINIVLPCNDINDLLLSEGEKEVYFKLLDRNAKKFEHGSIKSGIGDTSELMQPLKKGVHLDALPNTMRLLHGLREREFTIILAPPKCGKTTLCKLLHYNLMLAKQTTLGVYLEEDLIKTKQSFIALHAGVHLPYFRENPTKADPEKVKEAIEILDKPYTMFFDDVNGRMTPENVIQQFEWAAIKGVKYIIFDHLSFVFSGDKKTDERKGIDNLLTEIAAFVKKTGVHVIAVAHITRDKNKPKPKDKDGSIKYPYWYEVEETDGRGSGAFEQVCWNMIAIDKQVTSDKSRGLTRTKILYNREWDLTGIGDYLTMNKTTGRLEATQNEEY